MGNQLNKNYNNSLIHPTAIIEEGCKIGIGTRILPFSYIMPCTIGDRCTIGKNVFIAEGVLIGDNVKIENNVSIYKGVTCENDVFLGPSMVFTNLLFPRSTRVTEEQYMSTRVGKGASIGANATIVCGHNIGNYAFIGAGAVVTKEVLPYALIIGNPGKQAGWISEYGCKLAFDSLGIAICPESKHKYQLKDNSVTRIK
jgi:UDP-2-acetamido-3-amino-2,3-dideoxy-glucuronate N-acetyltransferase